MNRNWNALLEERWSLGYSVCVGLDSDLGQIPVKWRKNSTDVDAMRTIADFNKSIVAATHDIVCAYKPNLAFYIEHGAEGIEALRHTMGFIRRVAPKVPVILDTKDADIGNTNKGYAAFAFDHIGADAVTTNPYLGGGSLKPLLDRADRGVIVLCRTSNPEAGEFQDIWVSQKCGGSADMTFYEFVARRVTNHWNANGNCGLVVGATAPEELEYVREIAGDMPILIPGIGAQGGDVERTVKAGANSRNCGMIVNSSRGIIFASKGDDFAEAARRETEKLQGEINKHLN